MSTEVKEQSSASLRKELEGVKYHELKDVLESKGLGQAWKAGKKGEKIINDALDKFNEVKKLKSVDADQELIDKRLEEKDKAEELAKEEAKAKEESEAVEKDIIEKTELENKYTLEDGTLDIVALERAIGIVRANIRSNAHVKKRKFILVKRKNALVKLLEKANKQ